MSGYCLEDIGRPLLGGQKMECYDMHTAMQSDGSQSMEFRMGIRYEHQISGFGGAWAGSGLWVKRCLYTTYLS